GLVSLLALARGLIALLLFLATLLRLTLLAAILLRPTRADSGALGQWSPPSVRAAIGPASGPASLLACVAAIALSCPARAGSRCPERIVIVGLHRRVALLRLACFGLTPRQLPPIAQPY